VREAGLDPDNVEMYARDRNKWKNQIKIRMEEIREWEEQMAGKHRSNEQEVENITRNRKINSIRESLQCDLEHCGRLCKTKAGLKAHQRMAHREKIVEFDCYKCGESFSSQGVKQNHEEFCQGVPRGTCPYCLRTLSISNMARHKKQCSQFNEVQTGHSYKDKLGDKREKKECSVCNKMIVKSNMARHSRIHQQE